MTFNQYQLGIISAALRIASIQFQQDSKIALDAGHQRLSYQFDQQALDATAIYQTIGEVVGIEN